MKKYSFVLSFCALALVASSTTVFCQDEKLKALKKQLLAPKQTNEFVALKKQLIALEKRSKQKDPSHTSYKGSSHLDYMFTKGSSHLDYMFTLANEVLSKKYSQFKSNLYWHPQELGRLVITFTFEITKDEYIDDLFLALVKKLYHIPVGHLWATGNFHHQIFFLLKSKNKDYSFLLYLDRKKKHQISRVFGIDKINFLSICFSKKAQTLLLKKTSAN